MTRSGYDPTLFEETAWYYARYRLPYPKKLFEHLARCYRLDGAGRTLDLGCGTGQLAIPLAPYFEQVVGMDPDSGMLDEARRAAEAAAAANVQFVRGSSWDLAPAMGQFRLATMGDSFHWMDRDSVLRALYEMVTPGGGVVLVDQRAQPPEPYWPIVKGLLAEFLGPRRRAGQGFYTHPDEGHEVVLGRSRFTVMPSWIYEYNRNQTIDEVIGFLYSTSFASRRLLGDRAGEFEPELRRRLLDLEPSGTFSERIVVTALLSARA